MINAGVRRAAPAFVALLALLMTVQPASAATVLSTSGSPGVWSVQDSSSQPSVRCIYRHFENPPFGAQTNLNKIKVWPPKVFGTPTSPYARWRFHLRKFYYHEPSSTYKWKTVGKSNWQSRPATPGGKANFTPRAWVFPQQGENQVYGNAFRVWIQIKWGNQAYSTVNGSVLVELDWYRYVEPNYNDISQFPCEAVSAIT